MQKCGDFCGAGILPALLTFGASLKTSSMAVARK
jgi:hypothetical protein